MFDIGEIGKLNAEELMEYQASIKRKMDTEAAFSYVREAGIKEGIKETKKELVNKLLRLSEMSDKQITELVDVDLALVKAVRAELEKEEQA